MPTNARSSTRKCPAGGCAVPSRQVDAAAELRAREPCITVTPSWPSLTTPTSQNSVSGSHPAAGVPSPSIVWSFRSRVTLSAPITMPLLGQLTRLWWRVVSVVIVSPQLQLLRGGLGAARGDDAPRPRPGSPQARRASRGRRGGEAWLASFPPLSGRAGAGRLEVNLHPDAHRGQGRRARWALRVASAFA